MMKIGFIGFGEAAYNIAHGLKNNNKHEQLNIFAYDKMAVESTAFTPMIKERAKKADVQLVESLEKLIVESQFIVSATSSHVSIQVAKESAYYLDSSKVFIDMNSSSPETKKEIALIVKLTEATFVDAAILGSVPALRDQVPILVSGNGASAFKKVCDKLKMNVEMVNEDPGSASAVKMARSIFMKGFTALLIETFSLSNLMNIDEYIKTSLNETLQGKTIEKLAQQLIPRTAIHAGRRVGEMEEVMKTLERYHLNDTMSNATRTMLENINHNERFRNEE